MNTSNQKLMIAFLMTLYGVIGFSALLISQPVITVRFANPVHNCNNNTYCLDVEFQSNTPNQELFGMNVRFFYDDTALELIGFSGFVQNYSAVNPNPPNNSQSSASYGINFFGFQGAADYINGAVEKTSSGTPVYISTTGWTRLYTVCFLINTPYPSEQNFWPPVVWDLQQNPADGGFLGSQGVVITVAAGGNNSAPATANVDHFNWTYGPPQVWGHPILETSISVDCTLPVSLLSFTGFHSETGNHLEWQTAAEINNYGFEVQRSLDGIKWDALGLVEASTAFQQTKQYGFIDYRPATGRNLYRLKQIDFDGDFEYSPIVRLDAEGNKSSNDILVYPNPVSSGDAITVILPQSDVETSTVQMFSSTGQLLREEAKEGLSFELDVNYLQMGMYLLRITRGTEIFYTKMIIE